jgi:hypothetical protein
MAESRTRKTSRVVADDRAKKTVPGFENESVLANLHSFLARERINVSLLGKKPAAGPVRLDLVLSGGLFNGSFMAGSLLFLKEMHNQGHVDIRRISGCSVGALCGLLYFVGQLSLMTDLYDKLLAHFSFHRDLTIFHSFLDIILLPLLPSDIHVALSGKLYISFCHVKKMKKIIKKTYSSPKDVIQAIKKSCFVPYLIDGRPCFRGSYMDGINPFLFTARRDRKILHVDLWTYDKMKYAVSVKNEASNAHRVLSGVLDTHMFFIKQSPTQMCSYVNDWTWLDAFWHRVAKYVIEVVLVTAVWLSVWVFGNFKRRGLVSTIVIEMWASTVDFFCF